VSSHQSRGFTLIEAIVLIAILGILATIAVPNFIRLQTRTRTSEALTNLGLLRDAQASVYAELGTFIRAGEAPAGVPGTHPRPWVGANTLEFRLLLGFVPEGDVYFQYGANGAADAFTLTAVSDLDGSGARAQFGFVHAAPGQRVGIAHEFGSCARSGMYDPKSGLTTALDTVGPCGAEDGASRL